MINFYTELVEQDIEYILELKESIERFERVYKSNVFNKEFSKSIQGAIRSFKKEIFDVLQEAKANLVKSREIRSKLNEAHFAQLREHEDNVRREGRESTDTSQDVASTK